MSRRLRHVYTVKGVGVNAKLKLNASGAWECWSRDKKGHVSAYGKSPDEAAYRWLMAHKQAQELTDWTKLDQRRIREVRIRMNRKAFFEHARSFELLNQSV